MIGLFWLKESRAKRLAIVFCLLCLISNAAAQDNLHAAKSKKRSSANNNITERLDALQTAIAVQQQQIEALQEQLAAREVAIHDLHELVVQTQALTSAAQQKADAAVQVGAEQQSVIALVGSEVIGLKPKVISTDLAVQQTQKMVADLEHPTAIHFKDITITPGGFIELAGIYRSHNENGDVTSTFGNIPFSGTANSFLSEFRATARQSRISLLAEGRVNDWKMSGYYEADFLGAAPTANELESNSFNPRQRQLWG
jgi:TolA-binding protein